MTEYESDYRTVYRDRWARTYHDEGTKAKQGWCTVAGVEDPHKAQWSLRVRQTNDEEVWVAACKDHVPPDIEDEEAV